MNSQRILYGTSNDEKYTPRYAVLPLLPYIPKDAVIWCPFDTLNSEYVKVLQEHGYTVEFSHISDGRSYFEYAPPQWDIMVSNPPFAGKRQIFERALSFGKPFALLMSNTWLNDSAPKQLFEDIDLQLLMFDKRIEFDGQKKITFSSSYFCRDFLPKQIIMAKLKK